MFFFSTCTRMGMVSGQINKEAYTTTSKANARFIKCHEVNRSESPTRLSTMNKRNMTSFHMGNYKERIELAV